MKRRDFMLTAPVAGLTGASATDAQTAGPRSGATPYLDWLTTAATAALDSEAIGTPVSLRAHLNVAPNQQLLTSLLASTAAAAATWFDSPVFRISALDSPGGSTVTVLVEYEAGQTAILTSEVVSQQTSVTLLFFGNHGTMRFDDSPAAPALEPGPPVLTAAVERSLQSGDSVEVDRAP